MQATALVQVNDNGLDQGGSHVHDKKHPDSRYTLKINPTGCSDRLHKREKEESRMTSGVLIRQFGQWRCSQQRLSLDPTDNAVW